MAGMTPNDGSVFGGGSSNAAFKKQLNKVYTWYTGVEQNGCAQKYVTNHGTAHAHLLEDPKDHNEQNESAGIPSVDFI